MKTSVAGRGDLRQAGDRRSLHEGKVSGITRPTLYLVFEEEEGATMVEYAIMLALITAVAFATIAALGDPVNGLFKRLVDLWNAIA